MIVQTRYAGQSGIVNALTSAHLAFATNTLREPTFFEGQLAQPLLLREAMAALYRVVVSDFKYRPRERLAFFSCLAEHDRIFLASLGIHDQIVTKCSASAVARL